MAFLRKDLYCIGPAGSPRRMWMYHTVDALTTVDDSDYFVAAVNELQVGDIINVVVWTTTLYTGTIAASSTAAAAIAVVATCVPATPTVTTYVIQKIATA